MTLHFEAWRSVVDAHATEMARVLGDELGPIRARTVEVGHDEVGVVVMVDSGERDPWLTVWVVVVTISPLWEALGVEVAVTVDVGELAVVTPPAGMEAVVGGCDTGTWRRVLSGAMSPTAV